MNGGSSASCSGWEMEDDNAGMDALDDYVCDIACLTAYSRPGRHG